MKLAIIKYNAGNVTSVVNALERLGVNPEITDDPEKIKSADKVIFPGVGEASSAMKYIRERNIDELILSLKQPFLGVCVGLQLMCKHSEEGDVDCLGIFDVNVRKFESDLAKVPHVGWNKIADMQGDLFKGIVDMPYLYYVHSYYAEVKEGQTIATTDYIHPFSAALHKDNYYAIQGHAEKSGDTGSKILENFLSL
ncbi:imidazole glycerol phosphate synthase subunit HisH [Aureibacter tunicatorum]|uniref:Imidazole glycerol phosphate synthase subunit HisH n=1 Tax=Aureibacter tunicatorum TaxID=866807 RepID=A0AAE4BRY9_9BACT|nr:imidazole glycerol phosphate synthase subunit HisH [Aureibacter tunicatorum]MDR6239201.1 glutamine amidotransferase [Aureibacter tunicatorum]BDD04873.1 imidazole glycerol phosphate synthase subunit HisH [Aureibacter tunicatorum]